ncbi:uncharacterized protein LOC129908595 [Episyrphus balteatus]|uniref:uncharacterized protein LOC129908595 n=1 Tax=Episyrphus balteatus TaxID=286459 RepID=UPI0024861649|nr:uncharacterized protein LOC129908595 [Episyrphus balteatus]
MSALNNFIIAADQLVAFCTNFETISLVDQTPSKLEASKIELKDLWVEIKSRYTICLLPTPEGEEDLSDSDIESVKAKYLLSGNTYIQCLSEMIESIKKLNIIKADLQTFAPSQASVSGTAALSIIQTVPPTEFQSVPPQSAEIHQDQHLGSTNGVKVPACDTDIFYGDYLTWPSFRDIFTAVYINHPKLCSVQKLFHLHSKTKGEANNIVSRFPLTADSFNLAWAALTDQFENQRIIVNNQLKNLFNLSSVSIESGKGVRNLQREINDSLSILKAHKVNTDHWDPIIVYLCSNKLPEKTLSIWEQTLENPRDIPSWSAMDNFLTNRYRVLETVSDIKCQSKLKESTNKFKFFKSNNDKTQQHRSFHTNAKGYSCKLCNNNHPIRLCPTFIQLPIPDRISKQNCQSIHTCIYCKQKHHTMLHIPTASDSQLQSISPNPSSLNTGSEVTFISEAAQKRLSLPVRSIQAKISGIGSATTATASKMCSFLLGSKLNPDFSLSTNALVLKSLTGNLPTATIIQKESLAPFDFVLADPYYYESSKIDLLIGMDIYPSIKRYVHVQLSFFNAISLDRQIQNFFEIENIPDYKPLSEEDIFCEKLYSTTTSRGADGRYTVRLPFKDPTPALGHSRDIAFKQFQRMEKSFEKKPDLYVKYNQVLEEYSSLGHMEEVLSDEIIYENRVCSFFLPHHAVIKPDSISTKIRVVFNASNKSSTGVSLNDLLHTGPVLQSDLTTLILNWRLYRYVFNADIEKMYRQIRVDSEHTPYQRIWYRNPANEDNQVKTYELKTVTFGVNCAPFLAIRTLHKLSEDVQYTLPLASTILKEDFYVDDVLSGAHEIDSALRAQQELIEALESAGFPLRKWTSNCQDLLNNIPKAHLLNENILNLEDKSVSKTLGIRWNAKLDAFQFFFKTLASDIGLTKRSVISIIARLFDPAGWLAPVIITAKIIMQQVWRDGTSWDQEIAPLTCRRWKLFLTSLPFIERIQVPRWLQYDPTKPIQIHGFCDASEHAYAAAFYLRVQTSENSWSSNLICCKSKVAPVNQLPLPRLELCGAFLLAKLFTKVISKLKCPSNDLYCWTDSSIVLAWLDKPACTWKTFVANRISQIQTDLPHIKWSHVRSADNPADLATRGISPIELQNNNLWWNGPSWLCQPQSLWPQSLLKTAGEDDLERRAIKVYTSSIVSNVETVISRFSSWSRLLRVMSYVFRFFHLTHKKHKKFFRYTTTTVSKHEMDHVKGLVICLTQHLYYQPDYVKFLRKAPVSSKSRLLNLNPFMDKNHIIRSDSRLSCSTLSYNEKYPILLPYQAVISSLYVNYLHRITLHGGNQLVLRMVRCEFYIPYVKKLIKKCIHLCKPCQIQRMKLQTQIMGALPVERTIISSPFTYTGVDFAGPYLIKSFSGRNCRITKGYVCLFVCFGTKAIHLEAASDLSTDTFLGAFNRFISRRGLPKTLFSDNGTNFVGANKAISSDFKAFLESATDELCERYKDRNLEWKFIPPGAPHMGGIWEAGVKSFKLHFRKIAGTNKFTFEEFSTLLAKVEACLNSRPISPITENPADILPLTPGHFLRGGPLLSPLEPAMDESSLSCIKRWERVKILHHQFCRRWKDEYLKELNKRYKWKCPKRNIMLDDLVVIRDENLPPNEWRLGRIIKVYLGPDDKVRVVDVKTQNGVITRPITKLCILHEPDSEPQSEPEFKSPPEPSN